MRRIVVDASLPKILPHIPDTVELCDAAGNVIGVYTPHPSAFDNTEPEISEEELRKREAEPGGRSLSEILADLEKQG